MRLVSVLLVGCLGAGCACGMPNPASVYCGDHGGTLTIERGQVGVCHFSDGSSCEEWAYFRGECEPGAAPHVECATGYVSTDQESSDAGATALCVVPRVGCRASDELLTVQRCHYPPSPAPAIACCDPLPATCAASDCDCLMRNGPWIDASLAEDAGTSLIDYQGSKRKCTGELYCTPGLDGGVAVLSCSPA